MKLNESVICDETQGGCGARNDKFEIHQILQLTVQETYIEQSVQDMLNSPFNIEQLADYRCNIGQIDGCLLYTSPSPRDYAASRMPSSA